MICWAGDFDAIKLLEDKGADVNKRQGADVHEQSSFTPLMICAEGGLNFLGCRYLLRNGANPWLLGQATPSSNMYIAEEHGYTLNEENNESEVSHVVWLLRSLRMDGPESKGVVGGERACYICYNHLAGPSCNLPTKGFAAVDSVKVCARENCSIGRFHERCFDSQTEVCGFCTEVGDQADEAAQQAFARDAASNGGYQLADAAVPFPASSSAGGHEHEPGGASSKPDARARGSVPTPSAGRGRTSLQAPTGSSSAHAASPQEDPGEVMIKHIRDYSDHMKRREEAQRRERTAHALQLQKAHTRAEQLETEKEQGAAALSRLRTQNAQLRDSLKARRGEEKEGRAQIAALQAQIAQLQGQIGDQEMLRLRADQAQARIERLRKQRAEQQSQHEEVVRKLTDENARVLERLRSETQARDVMGNMTMNELLMEMSRAKRPRAEDL
ncbi:hypothetical protein B484DRAFT_392279 [Ochromonadaceae sp. CCMP2298]|nr:hypothetical protein B484DRAFT_392279 [Ochromonadaceae sp. CCMP2298]